MAAVDVGAVLSEIAAQSAPLAAVGLAVLLVVAGIKAFAWVRAALSSDAEYERQRDDLFRGWYDD